jgi:hypothetical protein
MRGMLGKHHSEETRRKISESWKIRRLIPVSKETRQKMSDAHKNPSEETRRKMSEAQKGEKNYMFGRHHSEEVLRKISETSKGRIPSEDTRRKLSESRKGKTPMLGKHHSEGTCQKISISNWKGGRKMSWFRHASKKRSLPVPNVFLNDNFSEAELHHTGVWVGVNQYLGIYVPKELNNPCFGGIAHSHYSERGLTEINFSAIRWWLRGFL